MSCRRAPSVSTCSSGSSGPRSPTTPTSSSWSRRPTPTSLPRLHVSTGTEDAAGLVKGNRRFVALLEDKGADVTSDFRPGEHVWQLWDDLLPEVIDWMLHP